MKDGKLHPNLLRKDGHIMKPRKENCLKWWTFWETVSNSYGFFKNINNIGKTVCTDKHWTACNY